MTRTTSIKPSPFIMHTLKNSTTVHLQIFSHVRCLVPGCDDDTLFEVLCALDNHLRRVYLPNAAESKQ